MFRRIRRRAVRARALAGAVLLVSCARVSAAQGGASGSNTGALTFTGGLDAPSVYVLRGIVQEGDPSLTLAPYGDLGVRLSSGGGLGSVRVNLGVWNSLQTGNAGTGGPLKALHYAERFYASVSFGPVKGLTISPGVLVNSSPNRGYDTIRELTLKVERSGRLAPYAFLAAELSEKGQLDGGSKKGTYLEFGASPSVRGPRRMTLALPLKVGVSLGGYYELFGRDLAFHDNRFGFFSAGGLVTLPLSTGGSRYGAWNLHGGADVLTLGETTKAFNQGHKTKAVALIGIGVAY